MTRIKEVMNNEALKAETESICVVVPVIKLI